MDVVKARQALLSLLVMGLLACGSGSGSSRDAAAGAAAQEPETTAPDFTLRDLQGHTVNLASLRGRPVLVDFWATWCAPCIHQIPVLNAVHARYGERVAVLGIAVDVGGAKDVAPFAADHDIQYRVLLGDEGLAQRYGAVGFPSLYLIDPAGGIRAAHVGVASEDELDAALDGLL